MTRSKKTIIEEIIDQIVENEKINPAMLNTKNLEPIAREMQKQIKELIEKEVKT